jgi:yclG
MKKYSLPFLLFLTICLLVTCKTFDAVDVYTDPAYDDTEVLQALLTQKAADVRIQKHPENRPYIVRPLKMQGIENKKIIFEPGVVVMAKKGEFHGKLDFLLSIEACKNIHIVGYGATFAMRKSDYRSAAYVKSEWRHGIRIASSDNVTIEGLKVKSTGGDGIYVGYDNSQASCKNTKLLNLTIEDNYRQGISVVAADGLLIEGCSIFGTRGTLPEAGIDFEPNGPSKELAGCVVRNCSFSYNKGAGIQIHLYYADPENFPLDMTFENCTSQRNGLAAFSIIQVPKKLKGTIRVINCNFKGIQFIKVPKSLIVTDK